MHRECGGVLLMLESTAPPQGRAASNRQLPTANWGLETGDW